MATISCQKFPDLFSRQKVFELVKMSYSSDEEEEKYVKNMERITQEIEKKKQDPELRGMFVSGWDDPDNDIGIEADPKPRGLYEQTLLIYLIFKLHFTVFHFRNTRERNTVGC